MAQIYDRMANSGLDSVLADMQQNRQRRQVMEEQQRRHDEAMKAQYLQSLMAGQPYERRVAIAKQYGIAAPEYVPNEQETAARALAERQRGIVEGWTPDKFQSDTAAMTLVTDKTPNQSTSETMRDRSYMSPDDFIKKLRIGGGLDMSAQQRGTLDETIRHNKVGEGFEGQKTAAQAFRDYAAGKHSNAQTGYAGAQTETEVQKRTPGSDFNKAHVERVAGAATATAGAKAAANPANKGDNGANLANDVVEGIGRLKVHPGMSGAVGMKDASHLFGLTNTPIKGTDEANFVADFDRIKALLTLPNLQHLKGLGHMSDKEFATLQAAGTSLSRDMSDEAFAAELARVEGVMRNIAARASQQGSVAAPSGGAPLTESEAVEFLRRAGGDPNKARELARQAGRSF
jgi:hypothetical protein